MFDRRAPIDTKIYSLVHSTDRFRRNFTFKRRLPIVNVCVVFFYDFTVRHLCVSVKLPKNCFQKFCGAYQSISIWYWGIHGDNDNLPFSIWIEECPPSAIQNIVFLFLSFFLSFFFFLFFFSVLLNRTRKSKPTTTKNKTTSKKKASQLETSPS